MQIWNEKTKKSAGKKINFILLSKVEIKALVVVLIDNKDEEQKLKGQKKILNENCKLQHKFMKAFIWNAGMRNKKCGKKSNLFKFNKRKIPKNNAKKIVEFFFLV